MNFATLQFILFFLVVFLIYWNIKGKYQNAFLLAVSYLFYSFWDWRFLLPIAVTTLTDYFCGRKISASGSLSAKKAWLTTSLMVNLGILGYFKYFNFFAESAAAGFRYLGWPISSATFHILLPVGISFYTFRSLSYVLDIYRGREKPVDSLLPYALFVSYFPHLAAGPITRAGQFIPQIERPRLFTGIDLQEGIVRFIQGYFKKVFIADTLGFYLVDPLFSDPDRYAAAFHWLAMLGYSVQIYADFSGYSSMAIGISRILGLRLPENFQFPHLSRNISDFWRRWHITMSQFFRDYVYIALGGNRGTRLGTAGNLVITTFLSGLWHGAGFTYIFWGLLHGLYIVVYHFWSAIRTRFGAANRPLIVGATFLSWVVTQMAVGLAWILFRSPDVSTSFRFLRGLALSSGEAPLDLPLRIWIALLFFAIDHLAGSIGEKQGEIHFRIPVALKGFYYAAMIVFLYEMRIEVASPFIYFKY
jgi:alginate O-acetyltransferase complex protein AlgI